MTKPHNLAPIVLFVYNRPWHTQRTIEALQANELANESELIVFADGAKSSKDTEMVREVREYIHSVTGFKDIKIHEQDKNLGLANSVIAGVTQVVNEYGRIIVLEDDMVTSPYFLRYMNDALELYKDEEKVISIHGYMYPVEENLPETFFLKGADCWGWATWKRGWDLFEVDGKKLLRSFKSRRQRKEFDFNGSFPYYKMLIRQTKKQVDSWAIRWYASAFLKGKLTLYPGKSLVHNIGLDNSGVHCGNDSSYTGNRNFQKIECSPQIASENLNAKTILSTFFRNRHQIQFRKKIKIILKKLAPEFILDLWLSRNKNTFTGIYSSWEEAEKICSGYDQDNILRKVADATEKVVAGEAVFERDSMLFYHEEYNWPLVNTLLRIASKNNNELCVLDFGGALGSTYFQNKKQLSSLNRLKWCVVEQTNFAKLGADKFQTNELCFYENIDSCTKENNISVVLLSSVLQYLENPYDILEHLKKVKAGWLIVDRMPVLKEKSVDRLAVQHVPAAIYKASYPIRFLAEINLLSCIEEEYDLLEKFDSLGGRMTLEKPHEYAFYMGYIFKLKKIG